jgi:hypothetical protein
MQAYRIIRNIGWLIAAAMTLLCIALWMRLNCLERTVSDLRMQVEAAKARTKLSPVNGGADRDTMPTAVAEDLNRHPAKATKSKFVSLASVLNDHPEFSAVWRRFIRRDVLKENREMFSHLNLPAEKLEKLKDMLVEKRLSEMDAVDAATRNGMDSLGILAARKRAQSESDEEIESYLGPAGFREWRQAEAVQVYQTNEAVQDIVIDTNDMGAPMTNDQTWKLKEAFHASAQESFGTNQLDPSTGLRPSDQDQLARAASFLSPAQVQALRDIFIQFHQREAMLQSLGHVGISW